MTYYAFEERGKSFEAYIPSSTQVAILFMSCLRRSRVSTGAQQKLVVCLIVSPQSGNTLKPDTKGWRSRGAAVGSPPWTWLLRGSPQLRGSAPLACPVPILACWTRRSMAMAPISEVYERPRMDVLVLDHQRVHVLQSCSDSCDDDEQNDLS